MDPGLTALLACAAFIFAPGALAYRALVPGASKLEVVALAPSLSFGLVFLLGELTTLSSIPFGPIPFVGLVSLTALVAAARRTRGRTRSAPVPLWARLSRPGPALLLAAIGVGAASWFIGLRGLPATPPYTDSVNHGVMVAQVSRLQSLEPGRVLSSDPLAVSPTTTETAFYPLALHGQVSLAHRLFGVGIADGLLATTILFSVIVLPVSLFLAARTMAPESPFVAGLTAVLGASISFFPILPLSFGGLPFILGVAMVPAVAVAAGRYLTHGGTAVEAGVGVLGAIGILATHTSEIPLLAIILGCAVGEMIIRRPRFLPALLRRSAVFGAMSLLLIAPSLPALASGTAERSGIDERQAMSLLDAAGEFRSIVGFARDLDVLGILAVAGVVLCVMRRRHFAAVGTSGIVLALFLIAASLEGALNALTVPWYQHPGRVALNLVVVIPFFAAVALVDLGPALSRVLRRNRSEHGFAPAIAVMAVVAIAGISVNGSIMRTLFRERAIVGTDALAAFAYLRQHVEPAERVLNDGNTDGAMWMLPFEGVAPVMGLHPARPDASWEERLWLVRNVPNLGRDPRVGELLKKYNVRFMYYDEEVFPLNEHHVDGAALHESPHVCERFRSGSVRVFELSPNVTCA